MKRLLLLAALLSFSCPVFAKTIIVCDDIKDPETLDPQKEFSEKNHAIVQQVYEGLARIGSDGKVTPVLAISWERTDPLTLEFTLREGVSFHNGEPFNAESVRFSIERYINPQTGFPAFPFISTIDRVEVVNSSKVKIITKIPDGLLINRLAGFIVMVPPKYVKEHGDLALSTRPIGTGPFMFEDWKKGQRILLARNPNYWDKDFPKVDHLEFKFIPIDQQFPALLGGKIHVMTEMQGTYTLSAKEGALTDVIKIDSLSTSLAHFNTSRGILKDKRVRLAINYAVNKSEIIRYDLLGNGDPIASVSVPGLAGHDTSLTPYAFNLQKARELMQEAGVQHAVLKTLAVPQAKRVAGILKAQLKLINIDLDVHEVQDADVVGAFQKEEWDMGIAALPNPIAHVSFPMSLLFYSRSPYSLLKDPEFDHLFETAMATTDPKIQEAEFQNLDRYVYNNVLGIYIYRRIKTYGINKKLHFTPSVTGMPYYYDAFLRD